jgi:D-alanyl-D-alanine carboxypeptidase (penicillin-binding protein 5/6)
MMVPTARRGRIGPLLILAVVLLVVISILSAVALGQTAEAASASPTQSTVFTVDATDLGTFAADSPTIASPSAILVHADSGRVLYERNADKQRPMASTTKIMTAILILENMQLDTSVTVSAKAAQTIEPKTWLREGDVLTVEQLLYALMLRSANSAAVALAEACSGSVEEFASLMNEKAAELGMKDTKFVNPNGLDATGHYSTAADMAVVGRYAMKNARFRELVSTQTYTVSLPGRSEPTVFKNTNKLLGQVSWVNGIKTGLTPKAEQCLVGSASKDGVSVISVILGQPSSNVCWDESEALLRYGLAQYKHVTLLEKGVAVAETTVPNQLDGSLRLVTDDTLEMDLYKEDEVIASASLDEPVVLPVAAGDAYGRLILTIDGETVQAVDLVADRSVEKTTLGSKLSYYWSRLGRWLGGN